MARERDTSLPGGRVATTASGGGSTTPSVRSTPGSTFSGAGTVSAPGGSYADTTIRNSILRIPTRSIIRIPQRLGGYVGPSRADRFSSDSTSIAQTRIENNEFVTVTDNGISNFRPEIVATINFTPIWKPGQLNVNNVLVRDTSDIGDFLSFQYQTKQLRQETLQALIQNIKSNLPTDPFVDIKRDYETELRNVGNDLVFLNSILRNINTINNSLDIKNISDPEYSILENGTNVVIPSLQQIYTQRMQYSNQQYDRFSETKILLQLLFDLKNILNSYSVNLINLRDNDRVADLSPTVIDRTYTLQNAFSFNISDYKSTAAPINAFQIFEQFMQSLPEEPDSKIKLLTYLLAKEYLISTGIGNVSNQPLFNKYNNTLTTGLVAVTGPNSDIFNNIVGNVGETIFEKPIGNINTGNSLVSLMYVDTGPATNNTVLPFENRYIQTDDLTTTYVPGTSYFTDAIIKTDGSRWNIAPYSQYANRFNSVFSDAKSAINRLLNLSSFTRTGQDVSVGGTTSTVISAISPNELNSLFVQKFQTSFKRLNNFDQLANDATEADLNRQIQDLESQAEGVRRSISVEVGRLEQASRQIEDAYLSDAQAKAVAQDRITNERIRVTSGKLEEIRAINNRIQNLKQQIIEIISPEALNNSFCMALFNEASNNPILKKYILFMCFFAGMYRNASNSGTTRSDFYMNLVKNELKQFIDIYNYMPQDRGGGTSGPLFPEIYLSLSLNPNEPQFNIGSFADAFGYYIRDVITPYILEVMFSIEQATEAGREAELTKSRDPGFFAGSQLIETATFKTDEISDALYNILTNTDGKFTNNIFHQINMLFEELYNSTKLSNQIVHVTSNGKTKYNSLSSSVQYLFAFETFIQYAKKYSGIKLKGTINKIDNNKFSILEGALQGYLTSGQPEEVRRRVLIDRYFDSTTAEPSTILYAVINIDIVKHNAVQDAFDLVKVGNPVDVSNISDERQNTQEYSDLYDNYRKISDEFNSIKDMLGAFEVINGRIQEAYRVVNNFFKQEKLQQFLASSTINNIELLRYPSQIRLAKQIYDDIVDKTSFTAGLVTLPGGPGRAETTAQPLIVSDVIIPSEYNAMISMLSSNLTMLETIPTTDVLSTTIERNSKIVTIGIPAGFTKKLADSVTVSTFNRQGGSTKQSDVIAINIYPNDIRFGEIVLKPFTYYFDTSLFVTKKDFLDLNAAQNESFADLLSRISVKDFENPYDIQLLLRQNILNDSRYSFLNNQQINDLYNNLIISYLLGLYVNCLTGTRYTEDVFISPSSKRILNPKSDDAIKRYLLKIQEVAATERSAIGSYTNTEDVLLNPRFTQNYKDTYRLMTYGSLVFNEKEITKRVNGTKIFDRVYHIPVRLNSLEIDLDVTNSTISGQAALARASTQRHIVVDGEKQYLTTNEPNDFIIKDIFCAAATTDTGINISEIPTYIAATVARPAGPAVLRPGSFVPRTTGTPGG
jgi:hypothetical protein